MLKSRLGTSYERKVVHIAENEYLEQEAKFALEFIIKWGCIAAETDGEDSSGRQKFKLASEEMLIERGFKTARLFMAHAHDKGLVHTCPDIPDQEEEK